MLLKICIPQLIQMGQGQIKSKQFQNKKVKEYGIENLNVTHDEKTKTK